MPRIRPSSVVVQRDTSMRPLWRPTVSEKDVPRASERAAWNAAGTSDWRFAVPDASHGAPIAMLREQPPNSTTEHHEIEGGHGSSHQRPSKPETRRAPYPGTVDYCLSNTREPQRVATLSIHSGERFGSIPKPYLCHRKPSTSSHRQLRRNHPDLTAIKVWTADSQILIFSVYIPPVPMHTPDGASAEATLSAIHDMTQNVKRDDSRTFSLVLAGDFSRHHPACGSNHIQPRFIEDTGELINFFHDHGLQSCLPWGTATFWSLSHRGRNSTIGQSVFARSANLTAIIYVCVFI